MGFSCSNYTVFLQYLLFWRTLAALQNVLSYSCSKLGKIKCSELGGLNYSYIHIKPFSLSTRTWSSPCSMTLCFWDDQVEKKGVICTSPLKLNNINTNSCLCIRVHASLCVFIAVTFNCVRGLTRPVNSSLQDGHWMIYSTHSHMFMLQQFLHIYTLSNSKTNKTSDFKFQTPDAVPLKERPTDKISSGTQMIFSCWPKMCHWKVSAVTTQLQWKQNIFRILSHNFIAILAPLLHDGSVGMSFSPPPFDGLKLSENIPRIINLTGFCVVPF